MADKVRHLRSRRLRNGWGWYWIPSAHVAALGLVNEALGETMEPRPTPAIIKRAIDLNGLADEVRTGRRKQAEQDAPGTVGFLLREYRSSRKWGRLKPRTQKDYRVWLDEFRDTFRDLSIRGITGPVMDTWIETIREERGDYAAYHALGTMRALWAWAERKELATVNPAKKVENERPGKRKHRWTLRQIAAFVQEAFNQGEYGIAVAALVMDWTAQSPVDVWSLTREDYDGANIRTDRRAKVKGEHPPMDLSEQCVTALDWYLSTRPALLPDAPLFPPEGQNIPWVESTRYKAIQRIRKGAKLPAYLQLQDLRRSAATEAGEAGATALGVKALLRHDTMSEASTYTLETAKARAAVSDLRKAARAQSRDEC